MKWFSYALLASCACGASVACAPRERVVAYQHDAATDWGPFSDPVLLTGILDASELIQDPWLSSDELQIFFASIQAGNYDIWTSARASTGAAWQPARVVDELASDSADLEPTLTADRLTLYFASDRPAPQPGFHVWVAHRTTLSQPWSEPEPVDLGPSVTDRGPTVDSSGTLLVFASERGTDDLDLYQAAQATPAAGFAAPMPLSELNGSTFDWDPGLYAAGLGLVFASRRGGDQQTSDLYETRRVSLTEPWAAPQGLTILDSANTEGDPWLSEDGRHIVFSSDRSGLSQLYEAWR
jgi:Tol biopolymer transport system component